LETKLHIHWDGTAPGLAEHRLSLEAFGPALLALLAAARRIASGILKDAEDPNYGRRGGGLAKKARLLDLELSNVTGGSLGVTAVCRMRVPQGANGVLFDELPERATSRLLEAIEGESRGRASNALVRRFLQRLPEGVHAQTYELWQDGTKVRSVEIGAVKLPELPKAQPYLMQLDGAIVGLGLEPVSPEVRIASNEHKYTCSATMQQVERAIELRQEPVRALVLVGKTIKLLWVRPMREAGAFEDSARRTTYLLDHWDGLLTRLAQ
jgi:hypothetical protein